MDMFRRIRDQFGALLGSMAPSQRLTLLVIPALVVAALIGLMYKTSGEVEEHLLGGKIFSAEELRSAQEALQKAGLQRFKLDGQKILVPKAEATKYSAALVTNGGMPANFSAELEKMHEKANWFTTDRERQELRELGKQKMLANLIKAIPDIEDANVIWERSKSRPFGGAGKVTASVSVRPKQGREISQSFVGSLRHLVAGAVADLAPGDVTIFNMSNGVAYRPEDPNDPFNSQFLDQVKQFSALHQANITKALAYIPNVIVSVNVDLDNLKAAVEKETTFDAKPFSVRTTEQKENLKSEERRPSEEPGQASNMPRNLKPALASQSQRNSEKTASASENVPISQKQIEKTIVGMLPRSVQVSVSIPKDYFREVALRQGESETDKVAFQAKTLSIETETLKQVRDKVSKLIPANLSGAAGDNISISSYVRLDTTPTTTPVTLVERSGEMLAEWGGPAGLTLFALWILWTLNRSVKRLPHQLASGRGDASKGGEGSGSGGSGGRGGSGTHAPEEDEPEAPKEPDKRDRLQGLVRDNPEMAAAVISRWLSPSK